jgi:hypothetical protein
LYKKIGRSLFPQSIVIATELQPKNHSTGFQ